MLCEHRKTLDKIAAFLIERETITGKEFMEIFHEAEGTEGQEPMTETALQEEKVTVDPVSDIPEEKKVQEPVKEDSQESPIRE